MPPLSTRAKRHLTVSTADLNASSEISDAIDANSLAAAALNSGLDAANVKPATNAASVGAIPIIFTAAIVDATGDTDIVMTHRVRVVDVTFNATGNAAHATLDTIQVKYNALPITEAMPKTAVVGAVVRPATINAGNSILLAGGTLRISAVKNLNVGGIITITAVRV